VNGPSRASQFPLPFDHRPSLGGEDFLVSPCNSAAVAWIDRWPEWPGPALALAGAGASGKTHLASVFAARTDGRLVDAARLAATPPAELAEAAAPLILDDADRLAGDEAGERALFHLLNYLAGQKGRLLLTGALPPARWKVALPDLASRLGALPVAEIGAPDDGLMGALLVKLFADRQLQVGADVIAFMVARMERSFAAARALVAAVDARALESRRAITVPLVRAVLEAAQD
jgi:chromosomal replication initiation ATPase DnaA